MPNRNLEHLPEALSSHIPYLLVVLGKRSQRLFTESLARHNLRPPHFDILVTLEVQGAISQAALAEILRIEPAHMVALLDELEKFGFLERKNSPNDRRKYELKLTESGTRILKTLKKVGSEVENQIIKKLNAQEIVTLRQFLQTLAK